MERALIVSGSEKGIDAVAQLLKNAGYSQITAINSGSEARRLINTTEYELIVINTPVSDEFGHELAVMMSESSTAGIILICRAEIADDVSDKVGEFGVCVISKPLNRSVFHQLLKLVQATRARMLGLKKENVKLLTKIDELRLINRAKCALMEYLKLTEPQAHRYIEKQAMDNRQTRKEVAMNILSRYER